LKNNADGHNTLGRHLKARFGLLVLRLLLVLVFSAPWEASFDPAVIFLFLFTAIACSFAAFAYAEFASMVPVRSAYTYSYVAFGN
jgi:amino acid transporter